VSTLYPWVSTLSPWVSTLYQRFIPRFIHALRFTLHAFHLFSTESQSPREPISDFGHRNFQKPNPGSDGLPSMEGLFSA